jgi:crotonobetainyl-CoA:carnitine CoA-transferase CaiB-like acyl-CoA transferase
VVVAITPFGLDGPYAGRPASDLTLQAESGALAVRGRAFEEPVQMGGRTALWLAGAYAAAAALAYWRRRRDGGPGAFVDLSLAEVANLGASNFMDVFFAVGPSVDAEPQGSPRSFETPSIERSADGWVGFNTNAPHQIDGFLRMLGRDDLADSGELMMVAQRLARADEFQAMVTEWTSARTTAEIIERAVERNVPVAPVCNGRTVAEVDHVVARRGLAPLPGTGAVVPRRPWRFDGEVPPDPEAAPDRAGAASAVTWPDRAPLPEPGAANGAGPLAGLRVLDLTAWWAGPAATGLLAALGADVVHVEGPARMDGMRTVGMMWGSRPEWWELSPFFLAVNTNKRDVAIDIGTERGVRLVRDLARRADIVVENFTPKVLEKIGLGWETLHADDPTTILVRMPAFGLDGPWRDRPGFAQNIEQASGLAWITGHVDDQPRIQRGPCDPNGGVHAVIALLAALDRRAETGRGSLVEVALFDAALGLAAEPIVRWSADGELMERMGNRAEHDAPQGVYRAAGADGWLALTVADDDQWRSLCGVLGRDDLAADPRFATAAGRHEHHDELDRVIGGWTATRDPHDAAAGLAAAGIPAGAATDPRLTARHPQFRARGYHEMVEHRVAGSLPLPTVPFRVDGVERWTRTPAPCFAQHADEVLEELGLDADARAALRADGTIADRPAGM